ncbi:MAG: Rieske 2Fe-2S domain-containing protein [Cyanobacteria bacterium J06639_16]
MMTLATKRKAQLRGYSQPPFPSGWFRVAFSDELPLGKVMPLHYFGKHLVLFRTEDGTAHVMDAYCPHMGSHLGYGGYVKGNTIYCPYHTWGFNCQGQCVEVPYSHKTPPKVKLPTWPVYEVDDVIMVYFHPKQKLPNWDFPGIQGWDAQVWSPFKRLNWKLRTHVQEFPENIVHDAHFSCIHSFSDTKEIALDTTGPFFKRSLSFKREINNRLGLVANSQLEVTEFGLGALVAKIETHFGIGKVELMTACFFTPIDEEYVDVTFLYCSKKILGGLGNLVLDALVLADIKKQSKADYDVFEHKVYLKRNLLDKEDGPIAKYQHWAHQFYPETT